MNGRTFDFFLDDETLEELSREPAAEKPWQDRLRGWPDDAVADSARHHVDRFHETMRNDEADPDNSYEYFKMLRCEAYMIERCRDELHHRRRDDLIEQIIAPWLASADHREFRRDSAFAALFRAGLPKLEPKCEIMPNGGVMIGTISDEKRERRRLKRGEIADVDDCYWRCSWRGCASVDETLALLLHEESQLLGEALDKPGLLVCREHCAAVASLMDDSFSESETMI